MSTETTDEVDTVDKGEWVEFTLEPDENADIYIMPTSTPRLSRTPAPSSQRATPPSDRAVIFSPTVILCTSSVRSSAGTSAGRRSVEQQYQMQYKVKSQLCDSCSFSRPRSHPPNINTPSVIKHVSYLFNGMPSLIQSINAFPACSTNPLDANLITVTTPTSTMMQTTVPVRPGSCGPPTHPRRPTPTVRPLFPAWCTPPTHSCQTTRIPPTSRCSIPS